MRLSIYLDQKELLLLLFPIDFPEDLKRLILGFSGHLVVGHKSVSWLYYF